LKEVKYYIANAMSEKPVYKEKTAEDPSSASSHVIGHCIMPILNLLFCWLVLHLTTGKRLPASGVLESVCFLTQSTQKQPQGQL
jgi:hypothetical protein